MSTIKHDLEHEVYLDPKDNKEHINHGMLEYSKDDLENVHAEYEEYHKLYYNMKEQFVKMETLREVAVST